MKKYLVTINDDYDDWKIKGLLAEVVGWDRDKRFLVKLLEDSQTEYLNIGDAIWLKPHLLDGIYDHMTLFTAIHILPYDLADRRTKEERWKEYKERVKRFKTEFFIIEGGNKYSNLTRKQVIGHMKHIKDKGTDFFIGLNIKSKRFCASGSVIECDQDGYWLPNNSKEVTKRIKNFQNKIAKLVES